MTAMNIFRNIRTTFYVFLLILTSVSCNRSVHSFEKIEFENVYKFNDQIDNKLKSDTVFGKYQFSAWEYGFKGDYKNALIQWDLGFEPVNRSYTKEKIDSINRKYKKICAKEYIIEQSKSNRIIIINEAHHSSLHRVFTRSLLQELFDNGYTNLGIEDLANGKKRDTLLYKRKYPIQNTGFYIKDPQFGNMIRTALNIGYNVFAYEDTTNSDRGPREIEQARNIQKIIKKRPDEKFLIHCGFGHVLEGAYGDWGKTMAGRLSEFTGINPLTINQNSLNERSKPEFSPPLLKALNINEPTVLLDEDNNPFRYEDGESWSDIVVFHPNTRYINGRPNWLFENGAKAVPIALEEFDVSYPVMILAYKKGEDIKNGIPMDIVEVKDEADKKNLVLKRGDYQIVITNEKGDARKFKLNVN